MRKILLITLLFLINNIVYSKDSLNFVKDEIIIKIDYEKIEDSFKNSSNTFFSINSAINFGKISIEEKGKFFKLLGSQVKIKKLLTHIQLKDSISTSRDGKFINIKDVLGISILKLDKTNYDIKELCDSLSKLSFIIYAEPNYLNQLLGNPPNDEFYSSQKSLEQTNNIDIDVERAWDFTLGNNGVKVGVVDYGINYNNFDLGDGNWGNSGDKVRGGWDYPYNDSDPEYYGYNDHGSSVAGIIGAIRNNNEGVAGISGGDGNSNIGCQLFSLKIGPDQYGQVQTSFIIAAIIDGATGYGCHILNLSLGGQVYNESVRDAIRIAAQNNVVVCAATGNDNLNNIDYPAGYDKNWVIAVGGSDENDERTVVTTPPEWAWGSNYGSGIDVVAPSVRNLVYTTYSNAYTEFGGTSAATPHVSGLAALILSEAIEQSRTLHFNDVEGLICSSAEDVNFSTYPGYDDYLGYGRINAGKALEMMNKPWQMNYHTATGGTLYDSTGWINVYFINPGGNMTTGIYSAKRIEVRKTITLPNYLNDAYIWTRTVNESVGWSQANPNYQLGYSEVFSRNGNQVTLRTFIYRLYNSLGQYIGYKPTTYDNVVFEYTTLGIPCYENVHLVETFSEDLDDNTTTISASNNITASNIIESNADVHYKAGSSIRLWPGVHIKEGSEFRANIDECEETTYSKINLSIKEKFIEHKKSSMLKLSPTRHLGMHWQRLKLEKRVYVRLLYLII